MLADSVWMWHMQVIFCLLNLHYDCSVCISLLSVLACSVCILSVYWSMQVACSVWLWPVELHSAYSVVQLLCPVCSSWWAHLAFDSLGLYLVCMLGFIFLHSLGVAWSVYREFAYFALAPQFVFVLHSVYFIHLCALCYSPGILSLHSAGGIYLVQFAFWFVGGHLFAQLASDCSVWRVCLTLKFHLACSVCISAHSVGAMLIQPAFGQVSHWWFSWWFAYPVCSELA